MTGLWIGFTALILFLLFLDLGVFHRQSQEISLGRALSWTAIWVAAALLFNVAIYFIYEHQWFGVNGRYGSPISGNTAALQYLTGYLVEKSLSLDNIFVISLIIGHFEIPQKYQHRVLFWGILGAIVLRGAMIGLGGVLINRFHGMVYIFGAVLIWAAVRMMRESRAEPRPPSNPLLNYFKKHRLVTRKLDGQNFIIRREGRMVATPLLQALILVEFSDVLFAVDSIPAVFSVTRDTFIVFTSNIFAILGLRSLYFVIAAIILKFHYLKHSLTVLLFFIGGKMLLSHHFPISVRVSLAVIVAVLSMGILVSVMKAHCGDAPLRSLLVLDRRLLAALGGGRAKSILSVFAVVAALWVGLAWEAFGLSGRQTLLAALVVAVLGGVWAGALLRRAQP